MPNVEKTYNLFLDDIREPIDVYAYTGYSPFLNDDWKIVRDYNQFVDFIECNWELLHVFPSLIAFDHDLALEDHYGADVNTDFKEKTGYDCAKWLVDFCINNELELPEYVCHSMNPAGKENIEMFLFNYEKFQNSEKEN